MTRPFRLTGLAGIGVDEMAARADTCDEAAILRLENLDTDIPPLALVIEATKKAILEDRNNSYLPFVGQRRLREAVAAHASRLSGVCYDGGRNVVISAGGLSGILNVLLAIIDTGDEVVLTDPTYIGLINRVRLASGSPKLVPFVRDGGVWTLDQDELRKAMTPKTRACLFMSPSMPSGAVFTQRDWELVADLVLDRKLWLIHDAAMQRILFDHHQVIDPAGLPGMAERTITVGSASKELRMIGWRVGWIVAPAELLGDLALVSMANVVVPVGFAQDAAAAALELGDSDVARATATWEGRRDAVLGELRGIPVTRPSGGWSLLVDGTELGMTGKELSKRLFDRGHVAATPMAGWGVVNGSQFLRLVFSNEPIHRLEGLGEKMRRAWLT